MPHDRALQKAVLTELECEPSVDAAHIGAPAVGGVMTLSGTVSSMADRAFACRTAWNAKAVSTVQDLLAVA
ncbi:MULTISPECIES: BON domain-containing protein [unclassified Sphingomonas]|uniref:BON domain-containing protein n=1 Tax=unclassified Sphingomonas TaxID=196159 RepID=UPI0009E9AFF5|nr:MULTISPECIES: BON domain-containing protein [unclassified Sphingomonas]